MKNRLMAALAVVCVSLSLASCVTFDDIMNDLKNIVAKTDKVIAANQDVFIKACRGGEIAHGQFMALVASGSVSAKDQANEAALYASGRKICYPDASQPNTIVAPKTLDEVLKAIPNVQAWLANLSNLAKRIAPQQ